MLYKKVKNKPPTLDSVVGELNVRKRFPLGTETSKSGIPDTGGGGPPLTASQKPAAR